LLADKEISDVTGLPVRQSARAQRLGIASCALDHAGVICFSIEEFFRWETARSLPRFLPSPGTP
jgi:hypothetical protein